MKITAVRVQKHNLGLIRPYTIAFKTTDSVENGIIEIETDKGLTGYGAFNPSYEVIGETLEQALDWLIDDKLEWILGYDISDFNILNIILTEIGCRFSASPSARIGLEIAIYDLFTKGLRIPLATFFGQKIFSMPTSVTIGIRNVADTLAEAKEYIDQHFKILKIKIGISPEEDVERLIKIRERYKFSFQLIVDMNQGYSPEKMEWFCHQTKNLDIQLIEQPFKRGQEPMMRKLPTSTRKLIAADESLITASDARELASEPRACGFFNIKLMKCGGFHEAFDIAAIAGENKVGLMWGCNNESTISITAALHAAFSCGHTKFIDLDGSFDLAADVMKGGFVLKEGVMSVSENYGLGVTPI